MNRPPVDERNNTSVVRSRRRSSAEGVQQQGQRRPSPPLHPTPDMDQNCNQHQQGTTAATSAVVPSPRPGRFEQREGVAGSNISDTVGGSTTVKVQANQRIRTGGEDVDFSNNSTNNINFTTMGGMGRMGTGMMQMGIGMSNRGIADRAEIGIGASTLHNSGSFLGGSGGGVPGDVGYGGRGGAGIIRTLNTTDFASLVPRGSDGTYDTVVGRESRMHLPSLSVVDNFSNSYGGIGVGDSIVDVSTSPNQDNISHHQWNSFGYNSHQLSSSGCITPSGTGPNFGGSGGSVSGFGTDVGIGSSSGSVNNVAVSSEEARAQADREDELLLNLLLARRQRARAGFEANATAVTASRTGAAGSGSTMAMGGGGGGGMGGMSSMMGIGGSMGAGGLDLGMSSSQGSSLRMSRGIGGHGDSSLRGLGMRSSGSEFPDMSSLYGDTALDFPMTMTNNSRRGGNDRNYPAAGIMMNDYHPQSSSSSVGGIGGASLSSVEISAMGNHQAVVEQLNLQQQQQKQQQHRMRRAGTMLPSFGDPLSQSQSGGGLMSSSRYNNNLQQYQQLQLQQQRQLQLRQRQQQQQLLASSHRAGRRFSSSMPLDGNIGIRDNTDNMMMMPQYSNRIHNNMFGGDAMSSFNQHQAVSNNNMGTGGGGFRSHQHHTGLFGHLGAANTSTASVVAGSGTMTNSLHNRLAQTDSRHPQSTIMDRDASASDRIKLSPQTMIADARSHRADGDAVVDQSSIMTGGGLTTRAESVDRGGTKRSYSGSNGPAGQQLDKLLTAESSNSGLNMNMHNNPNEQQHSGTKRSHKKKPADMPRRPLSAYNLFFSEERERILSDMEKTKDGGVASKQNDDRDGKRGDCGEASDNEDIASPDEAAAPSKKGSHPEPPDSTMENRAQGESIVSMSSKPKALLGPLIPAEKKRRPHRKTHGKISFQQLARMVGERWKALKQSERQYYQDLAKEDMKRQKVAMEKYYARQQNKVNASDCESSITSIQKIPPQELTKIGTDSFTVKRSSNDKSAKNKTKEIGEPMMKKRINVRKPQDALKKGDIHRTVVSKKKQSFSSQGGTGTALDKAKPEGGAS